EEGLRLFEAEELLAWIGLAVGSVPRGPRLEPLDEPRERDPTTDARHEPIASRREEGRGRESEESQKDGTPAAHVVDTCAATALFRSIAATAHCRPGRSAEGLPARTLAAVAAATVELVGVPEDVEVVGARDEALGLLDPLVVELDDLVALGADEVVVV